jgi:2-polyprenyl-6-hydroxyphenyl methylase/3-demethylubiquinone-9 3-methyltransferase
MLVTAVDIRPGMTVLDVAAGNGNFAIVAARRGAAVIASDLTPRMVELGRMRSDAEGLAIEWREADAEELPFDTDRFDVVASVFGAMFAPQPERVAAELFRVAKPGGCVAMANYAPVGFLEQFAERIARYAPPPPAALPSPFAWGDPDEARRRFEKYASAVEIVLRTLTFTFDSVEQGMEFWERTNAALIALRHIVPAETYRAALADTATLLTDVGRADGGQLAVDSAYIQIFAHKKSSSGIS